MIDDESFWNILIDEMAVELPCTTQDCTLGPGGTVFKTPALEFDIALKYLDRHLLSHGVQGAGGGGGAAEGEGEVLVRPSISKGCSQSEFEHFKMAWTAYVMASNETNEVLIRDQLFYCPDREIRKTLERTLGDRLDTISVMEMLKEIETIAVQKEDKTSNKLGVDAAKSTVTWGMQLMVERDKILEELAEQVKNEYKYPSLVELDTDKFVPTKGREQCHQLLLDREGIPTDAKSSHSQQRGQGGPRRKKTPKSDLKGSCQVFVLEDTPAIVRLYNKQMVDEEMKQHHQLKLGGTSGGQKGGARQKKTPKPDPYDTNVESCQDDALEDTVYIEGEDTFDKGSAIQLKGPRNTAMVGIDEYVQQEQG